MVTLAPARQGELEYLREKRDKLYEQTELGQLNVEIEIITEGIEEILNERKQ